MLTLDDFSGLQPEPTREESVPVGPPVIRNFPLAWLTATEERKRREYKDPVDIISNGSMDKPATEWQVRRVVR